MLHGIAFILQLLDLERVEIINRVITAIGVGFTFGDRGAALAIRD